MFIVKNNALFILFNILILLFILTQILQLSKTHHFFSHIALFSPKLSTNQSVAGNSDLSSVGTRTILENRSIYIFLNDHKRFCNYNWRQFVIAINDCERYPKGSILHIIGSYEGVVASANNSQKRLTVKSIDLLMDTVDSDMQSVSKTLIFIQRIIWQIFDFKDFGIQQIAQTHSYFAYQLVSAMVLGDRSQLTENMRHYFEVTGMLHVLAVSGMHVGLIFIMLKTTLSRFSSVLRFFTQVVCVALFAVMVGGTASVVRASTMLVFSLLVSEVFFRKNNSTRVLFFCVVTMITANDWYFQQVSFQLSVAATAAILVWNTIQKRAKGAKGWQNISSGSWQLLLGSIYDQPEMREASIHSTLGRVMYSVIRYTREIFLLSLAIQLLIAPLLWWHFGQISWVGLLASPLVLWLIPPLFIFEVLFLSLRFFPQLLQLFLSTFTILLSKMLLVDTTAPFSTIMWFVTNACNLLSLLPLIVVEICSFVLVFILEKLTVVLHPYAFISFQIVPQEFVVLPWIYVSIMSWYCLVILFLFFVNWLLNTRVNQVPIMNL